MQGSPTDRIRETFGWNGFPDSLFHEASYVLRFDLGGEQNSDPLRFMRAIDRAREVAASVFAQSRSMTAIVGYYDGARRSPRAASSFKALAGIGFQGEFSKPERVPLKDKDHIAAFGEDLCAYWCSAEMSTSCEQRDALLWACIAREIDISPKARWLERIYIVDFEQGIVLNVYDDRGMDLAALDPGKLRPIYLAFNDWLSDYDRERMARTFTCNDAINR
ncbi:DUF3885 domain-containing protein [Pseudogemmobacter humi]|uniref:DUF3885 domain-containing protein n=1 Tax=Pseudogemmobacter humi TaxID=2483812 RepID=A0A3P5WUS3_9RHOB|nr:DUF3885 domain-containing protein [Pseudogemmobacter humi]VDC27068.1 hypothetical protein XINFAN_01760 [Pseudogemmobacter humi]